MRRRREHEMNGTGNKSLPLILVRWRDAWFDFDVKNVEECSEDYVVETVGYLIREMPQVLSVAAEVLPDGFRAVTHIHTASILDVLDVDELAESRRSA